MGLDVELNWLNLKIQCAFDAFVGDSISFIRCTVLCVEKKYYLTIGINCFLESFIEKVMGVKIS